METQKLAVVAPPKTVTLAGTDADGELLLRIIGHPPSGAAEAIVTVPITAEAPVAEFAPRVKPANVGGSKVMEAVFVLFPSFAMKLVVMTSPTGDVDTGNVAAVAPDGTVTDFGTVAAE